MGEERQLIERALHGEIEAWGEIVHRYRGAVYGISLGIVGNKDDAEDAAQDAFIRAYENLEKYDLNRKFSTWIFTIAANLCKNKLRRDKHTTPLDDSVPMDGTAEDPARTMEREAQASLVQQAMAELDEKYRSPMMLRFYAELDYKEIAEILELPEGTVKTRIHRAKAALKEWMVERGVKSNA